MSTKILILPGLGGSGENYWQSFWSTHLEHVVRLEQDHSLAVSLVAHWEDS